jgi:hypothetical protein
VPVTLGSKLIVSGTRGRIGVKDRLPQRARTSVRCVQYSEVRNALACFISEVMVITMLNPNPIAKETIQELRVTDLRIEFPPFGIGVYLSSEFSYSLYIERRKGVAFRFTSTDLLSASRCPGRSTVGWSLFQRSTYRKKTPELNDRDITTRPRRIPTESQSLLSRRIFGAQQCALGQQPEMLECSRRSKAGIGRRRHRGT